MKKNIIFGIGLTSILTASVGIAINNIRNIKTSVAEGYSVNTLPKYIDLNDTSASDIRDYYADLNKLTQSERKGTNLLKNLKDILKKDQKYYSYDGTNATGGKQIWQMYEIVDRDWNKSPASEISGYDSATNTISYYSYGSNYSNPGSNPYLHSLYVNRDVDNKMHAWVKENDTTGKVNHGDNAEWNIDREHIWPKSLGFPEKIREGGVDVETNRGPGAAGDPMHLLSGDSYVNSSLHSNYYYAYVDTSPSAYYLDGADKWSYTKNNYMGTSLNFGGYQNVFEPQDSDKGDIARAIFYMAARYNYFSGSDSDGIDANNPNLLVTNDLSTWESSNYLSSETVSGKVGILADLLAWHKADPVDEFEIHRNNLLYTNFTNNRNPFIDFPEWVDYIWGTADYNGRIYQSYDSTPTGYASPITDTINGYNSSSTDPQVVSVVVSPSALTLDIKDGQDADTVTATVNVINGAATTVNWSLTPSNQGVSISVNGNSVTVTASATATLGQYTLKATSTVDSTKYGESLISVVDSSITPPVDDYTSEGVSIHTGTNSTSAVVNVGTVSNPTIKVGTGSAGGNMTITFPAGATSLRFYVSAWKGENSSSISISGATCSPSSFDISPNTGISNSSPFTFIGSADSYLKTIELSGITQETTITISSEKRFVIWGAEYKHEEVKPTSITATVTKNFVVGETLTKSDITVEDDLGNVITDFDFDDYQFTFDDAASGGAQTEVNFDIEYNDLETLFTVLVNREEYVHTTDTLTRDLVGVTAGSYYAWSDKTDKTGAVYAGNSCGVYTPTGKDPVESIQIRNNSSKPSGIITTSSNGGMLEKMSVEWHSYNYSGRTVEVYGKNSPYDSVSDLYSTDTCGDLIGTLVCGTTDYINVDGDYEYVGIKAGNGTAYLTEIKIFYRSSAENFSNFVMFEDTANQCLTKTDEAITIFNELNVDERERFMDSDAYVITAARERFNAWLIHQGKEIVFDAGEYVVHTSSSRVQTLEKNDDKTIVNLVVISSLTAIALTALFVIKKRKSEK